MADTNLKIKLKKRDGAAFQDMYPQVSADNLLNASFGTLGTFSQEILTTAEDTEITYVSADADGGLNLRNPAEIKSTFSMESSTYDINGVETTDHNETFADVFACYLDVDGVYTYRASRWNGDTAFGTGDQSRCETAACSNPSYTDADSCVLNGHTWWPGGNWQNLTTALGNKADLDANDKILRDQLPAGINIKAMKFIGTTGELGSSSGSPTALYTLFSHLDNLQTSALDLLVGDYKIVTAATNFWVSSSPGLGSNTSDLYNWVMGSQYIDDSDGTSNTPIIQVENGDRIVFSHYTGSAPNSYTFYFSVINSNHGPATTSLRGVVGLSTQTALEDFSADNTTRHQKVIDESILRQAMKDQRKVVEFTGNTGTSKPIRFFASAVGNLGPGSTNQRALVGTGATKDIYEWISSAWADSGLDATFPTNLGTITYQDVEDIIYYDAGQDDYLYPSAAGRMADAGASQLPVDGDLVYWVSP